VRYAKTALRVALAANIPANAVGAPYARPAAKTKEL
jgi:hypothetical protein